MFYPVKKTFKISRAIVRETPEMLSAKEILSASNVKRIVVELGRCLKTELQVRSFKFQKNCKLQVFILNL